MPRAVGRYEREKGGGLAVSLAGSWGPRRHSRETRGCVCEMGRDVNTAAPQFPLPPPRGLPPPTQRDHAFGGLQMWTQDTTHGTESSWLVSSGEAQGRPLPLRVLSAPDLVVQRAGFHLSCY